MELDELDIYDDLDTFQKEEDKKSAELLALEAKYNESLKANETLLNENAELKKQIKRICINFQNLLDTAKSEIKRKDKRIEELRKEKDDICFRRKVQRPVNVEADGNSYSVNNLNKREEVIQRYNERAVMEVENNVKNIASQESHARDPRMRRENQKYAQQGEKPDKKPRNPFDCEHHADKDQHGTFRRGREEFKPSLTRDICRGRKTERDVEERGRREYLWEKGERRSREEYKRKEDSDRSGRREWSGRREDRQHREQRDRMPEDNNRPRNWSSDREKHFNKEEDSKRQHSTDRLQKSARYNREEKPRLNHSEGIREGHSSNNKPQEKSFNENKDNDVKARDKMNKNATEILTSKSDSINRKEEPRVKCTKVEENKSDKKAKPLKETAPLNNELENSNAAEKTIPNEKCNFLCNDMATDSKSSNLNDKSKNGLTKEKLLALEEQFIEKDIERSSNCILSNDGMTTPKKAALFNSIFGSTPSNAANVNNTLLSNVMTLLKNNSGSTTTSPSNYTDASETQITKTYTKNSDIDNCFVANKNCEGKVGKDSTWSLGGSASIENNNASTLLGLDDKNKKDNLVGQQEVKDNFEIVKNKMPTTEQNKDNKMSLKLANNAEKSKDLQSGIIILLSDEDEIENEIELNQATEARDDNVVVNVASLQGLSRNQSIVGPTNKVKILENIRLPNIYELRAQQRRLREEAAKKLKTNKVPVVKCDAVASLVTTVKEKDDTVKPMEVENVTADNKVTVEELKGVSDLQTPNTEANLRQHAYTEKPNENANVTSIETMNLIEEGNVEIMSVTSEIIDTEVIKASRDLWEAETNATEVPKLGTNGLVNEFQDAADAAKVVVAVIKESSQNQVEETNITPEAQISEIKLEEQQNSEMLVDNIDKEMKVEMQAETVTHKALIPISFSDASSATIIVPECQKPDNESMEFAVANEIDVQAKGDEFTENSSGLKKQEHKQPQDDTNTNCCVLEISDDEEIKADKVNNSTDNLKTEEKSTTDIYNKYSNKNNKNTSIQNNEQELAKPQQVSGDPKSAEDKKLATKLKNNSIKEIIEMGKEDKPMSKELTKHLNEDSKNEHANQRNNKIEVSDKPIKLNATKTEKSVKGRTAMTVKTRGRKPKLGKAEMSNTKIIKDKNGNIPTAKKTNHDALTVSDTALVAEMNNEKDKLEENLLQDKNVIPEKELEDAVAYLVNTMQAEKPYYAAQENIKDAFLQIEDDIQPIEFQENKETIKKSGLDEDSTKMALLQCGDDKESTNIECDKNVNVKSLQSSEPKLFYKKDPLLTADHNSLVDQMKRSEIVWKFKIPKLSEKRKREASDESRKASTITVNEELIGTTITKSISKGNEKNIPDVGLNWKKCKQVEKRSDEKKLYLMHNEIEIVEINGDVAKDRELIETRLLNVQTPEEKLTLSADLEKCERIIKEIDNWARRKVGVTTDIENTLLIETAPDEEVKMMAGEKVEDTSSESKTVKLPESKQSVQKVEHKNDCQTTRLNVEKTYAPLLQLKLCETHEKENEKQLANCTIAKTGKKEDSNNEEQSQSPSKRCKYDNTSDNKLAATHTKHHKADTTEQKVRAKDRRNASKNIQKEQNVFTKTLIETNKTNVGEKAEVKQPFDDPASKGTNVSFEMQAKETLRPALASTDGSSKAPNTSDICFVEVKGDEGTSKMITQTKPQSVVETINIIEVGKCARNEIYKKAEKSQSQSDEEQVEKLSSQQKLRIASTLEEATKPEKPSKHEERRKIDIKSDPKEIVSPKEEPESINNTRPKEKDSNTESLSFKRAGVESERQVTEDPETSNTKEKRAKLDTDTKRKVKAEKSSDISNADKKVPAITKVATITSIDKSMQIGTNQSIAIATIAGKKVKSNLTTINRNKRRRTDTATDEKENKNENEEDLMLRPKRKRKRCEMRIEDSENENDVDGDKQSSKTTTKQLCTTTTNNNDIIELLTSASHETSANNLLPGPQTPTSLPADISQDEQYKEIDSRMQLMFASPKITDKTATTTTTTNVSCVKPIQVDITDDDLEELLQQKQQLLKDLENADKEEKARKTTASTSSPLTLFSPLKTPTKQGLLSIDTLKPTSAIDFNVSDTCFSDLNSNSFQISPHNITIDETHSNEMDASMNSSTLSDSNSSTKHISFGSSDYRFEKISDNVVNLFITRKRRGKRKAMAAAVGVAAATTDTTQIKTTTKIDTIQAAT